MYRESLETWSKAEMHWCTETQSSKSRDKSVMVTQKVGQNDERVINESAPRERGVVSIVGDLVEKKIQCLSNGEVRDALPVYTTTQMGPFFLVCLG